MRRPFTTFLSLVLAVALSLLALEASTASPSGAAVSSAKPKATTKAVTAPIDVWKASAAQTPGGRLDYCAVTVFVVFPEIPGFEATEVDWVRNDQGVPREGGEILPGPPYSDQFTWGPLTRNAPAGQHQAMLGGQPATWQAGSPDCEVPYAATVAYWPTTAVVTYEAVDSCKVAIDAFNGADAALALAKKRLDKARTPAQKAAAKAQVRSAKAKLSKAKKKYKKKC